MVAWASVVSLARPDRRQAQQEERAAKELAVGIGNGEQPLSTPPRAAKGNAQASKEGRFASTSRLTAS